MELETIKVTNEVKYEFDKLQLDLKHEKKLRTQSELVKLLMNVFKDQNAINAKSEMEKKE